MKENKKNRGGPVWFVLIGCSVAAAAILHVGPVSSKESSLGAEEENNGLDYICVAEAAVPLRKREIEDLDRAEAKLEVRFAKAKRRCRPPLVPLLNGSEILGSGMDFDTGYGGMLSQHNGTKAQAIVAAETALKAVGWRETAASLRIQQIKEGTTVRVFDRDGAWLLAVSVDGAKDAEGMTEKSAVFVAGQWRREILERL